MGMTIDESIDYLSNENTRLKLSASDKDAIDRIISAYLITKANYNKQLKADMVAMLEEISLEFDEQYYVNRHELHDDSLNRGLEQGQRIIQQKIDALKENIDGES